MKKHAAHAAPQQKSAQQMHQENLAARHAVISRGFKIRQSIFNRTFQPANGVNVTVNPNNVGLIHGFLIEMTALITNPASGSSVLSLTPHGPANLLQQVVFNDIDNYQRINTVGWHLAHLASIRQKRPYFSSTPSDSPIGYGSNWNVIKAPATIAVNSTATVYMYYWIPLAYSDTDLTGAMYSNVINAQSTLQLVLSTAAQAVVANTVDPTLAVYQGAGAVAGVTLTNVTINVYQDYWDQLPMGPDGPILPAIDLNTIYELKNTAFPAPVVGQDTYIGFSNYRHFMSTVLIYDNQTGGAYPANGSDVNYISIRSANTLDLRKQDANSWASDTRRILNTDMPAGTYLFDTRGRPIFTSATGNMNIVLNPSLVNANAAILVGWEMLANVKQVASASSLAS